MTPDQPEPRERLAPPFDELDRKDQLDSARDTTMCSPIVDALAWQGPAHATKIQRAAILLWASGYIATGVSFLSLALKFRAPLIAFIGVIPFLVGIRITMNAFRPNQRSEKDENK